MALKITLEGNILTVVEVICSFPNTTRTYWYYDIENWLVSAHGREGDKPIRPMIPSAIEWVQKYYLPVVGRPYLPI